MATRTHRRWFGSRTRNNNLCSLLQNPCFLPQTLKMVTTQAASKRPICPSCSKPARLCLCSRIQNPGLHNSVSVTILQHSLEKNHPLNSARIARLGLKNLSVFTVSDVNFESQFVIRPLDSVSQMGSDRNGLKSLGFDEVVESRETQKLDFEYCDGFSPGEENVGKLGFGLSANLAEEKNNSSLIDCEKCNFGSDLGDMSSSQNQLGDVDFVEKEHEFSSEDFTDGIHVDGQCNVDEVSASTALDALSGDSDLGFDAVEGIERGNGDPVITATIGKHGVISSLSHNWMPQTCCKHLKFDTILDIADARGALSEGFVVRKLQKQPLKGSVELDEYVEFEVEVPPGSVLLFPSEEAVSVGDLEAMDIKVKNLIVLDGTWSKAKRMYGENPWLKLLPHLKLNVDKMSLYSEVRLQPKPGFLSTIESIVYALKAVGDSPEGLDNLLDVFRSMVEDQIRCKEERLSNVSPGLSDDAYEYDPPFSPVSKHPKPKKNLTQSKAPDPKNDPSRPLKSDLPFDFSYSYSETNPAVEPIAYRESPKFYPFRPGRLDRKWTRFVTPARQEVDLDRVAEERKRVLGYPLTEEEAAELVERYSHSDCSRQINMGKGGVTHNMLDDIHNHWKRAEAVRIKCLGVPTIDMDNVCFHLERYPPIYPKLVKNVADSLTFEETKELRNRGLNCPPLMKLTRNDVYVNVVDRVREAFNTEEVVRLDCTHVGTSDCKRIGVKLRDLAPCIPLLFKDEQIILWRGKEIKSKTPSA